MTTIKWSAAALGFVLAVALIVPRLLDDLSAAVTFGEDDAVEAATPTPEETEPPETTEGSVHPVATVGLRDGLLQGADADNLRLAPDDLEAILLAFEPLAADPACVTSASLEAVVFDTSVEEIHLHPARAPGVHTLADGDALPADARIEDIEPAIAAMPEGDARERVTWDATAAYSLAAREADPDDVVVLALRTPPGSQARAWVAAALDEDGEDRPRLAYTVIDGCPDTDTADT